MPVLKHLENKIKLVMIVSLLFMGGCIIISVGSLIIARGMVSDAHKKIYVLDGTVPVLVRQTTFTLAPDDKYIEYTIRKALYLVDESGLAQYNALKEKGFYNNVVGTSTICSIYCDSIQLDKKKMTFKYYGRQRIERRTSILMRQIVTAGELKRVPRTENNPHGFLIMNWRTLVNKDLEEQEKANY